MHRREGGHRLLEDHGDLVPPDPTDLGPLRVQDGQIHSAHVGVSTPEHPPAGDLPRLIDDLEDGATGDALDRKSTRLNSSHVSISYAVFCLKKIDKTLVEYVLLTRALLFDHPAAYQQLPQYA